MRRAFAALVALSACAWLAVAAPAAVAKPRVLRVGTYKGVGGQYKTVQAAVNHARPGDWILVAPGDYKTNSSDAPTGHPSRPAAVLITTRGLHLRGMNRNTVVLDGTRSGPKCNASKADQNFGPASKNGPLGLNGVMVWKARGVSVQNLTVCNFLSGSGDAGNGIWWNGGDGSGKIGGWNYYGSYMTATSTYFDPSDTSAAGAYGIFSSNWDGGTWDQAYASNMNDSGFYIGACQQECNQTVSHAWAEFNALGYSGSNSGGVLVVKHSQFDNNEDGFDTNSQNGDDPSPQNGACPHKGISPITHTHSCWVFMDNYVHDNNNPNVPATGYAAAGPVGTGMSLSGARNDTVMHNRFVHNDAWGTIVVPFPDSGPPCTGGQFIGSTCLFDEWGDGLIDNSYAHNGAYGNPTNGDFAVTNILESPTDCFKGNKDTAGPLTMTPSNAEKMYPKCTGKVVAPTDSNEQSARFTQEVSCDSTLSQSIASSPCLPTDHYPRPTTVVMHPLPKHLKTMPNPCGGVPANPWCPARKGSTRRAART